MQHPTKDHPLYPEWITLDNDLNAKRMVYQKAKSEGATDVEAASIKRAWDVAQETYDAFRVKLGEFDAKRA